MYRSKLLLYLLVVFLGGAASAFAQSTFGEIRGTVTDPTGQLVSGAIIKLTNAGTNDARETRSNDQGLYTLLNLPPGKWQLRIEKEGFQPFVTSEIDLRARDVVRIDASLAIGQVATEVVVSAVAQIVNTEQATVSNTRTSTEVQALPVNFRAGGTNSLFGALSFAPNVQTDSGGGGLSIGGGMPFTANSTVDGVSNINVRSNGILTEMFPSADSVSEIKISSVNNNAEFSQAGDITVVTRGGSNQVHGSAFWYHQNGAFDARDFFAARTPFKVSNDFGVTASGPVWKDKTFFLFSYEGLRFRNQSVINVILPPASYRTGNLSSVSTPILDPASGSGPNDRTPFPGNIIPPNRISPSSAVFLNRLYQLPNVPGDDVRNPNFRAQYSGGNDNDQYDGRIDHVFSQKQSLFGRISYKDITRSTPTALTAYGARLTGDNLWNLVIADNWVLRENIINEFRFGWHKRETPSTFGTTGSFDGPGLMREAGIQGIRADPPAGSQTPNISISGFQSTGQGRASITRSKNLQFIDNLSWIRGKHTFKFGTDIRRLGTTDITSFSTGDDMGDYSFDGTWSRNAFADFLLGYPISVFRANTGRDVNGITYHLGFYGQDDWKITNKLTLNIGLRYEIHPMFFDNARTTSNFDRAYPGPGGRVIIADEEARKYTAPAFITSIRGTPIVTAAEAGLPRTLRKTQYNALGPRFGFAWRPFANDKLVLRGGYGIFNATILGSVFYTITGIHVSDTGTIPGTLGPNGVPQLQFPRPFAGTATIPTPDFRRATQFDGEDPYTQQWSFTVERNLGFDTGLRISYTGSRTIKMFSSPDLNQVPVNKSGFAAAFPNRPYPVWNIVYTRDPNTQAWYNGMTIEINKRYSKGLSLNSSYTLAKHLTNAIGADGTGFASENGTVPTDRFNLMYDWGNVSSTRRHRFLTNAVYELPTGFLTRGDNFARKLLGGWQLSGILLVQTGPFLSPTINTGSDPSGTRPGNRGVAGRPDYAGSADGNLSGDKRSIDAWWDRSAFVVPANNIGRFGNVPANKLVGPGTFNLSARLAKRFQILERHFLQMEGSFSNLTNTPNFGLPARNIEAANFGRITSTQGAEQGGSRTIQIGARYTF